MAAWVREFIRWLPEMNVVFYTGDASSRRMIRQYEFDPLRGSKAMDTGVKFHVLLISPELAMMDMAHLEPFRWAMIAVDDAHHLKNKDSELTPQVFGFGLSSANRLLVTGYSSSEFSCEAMGIDARFESRPV
jgi:chromodomain-helicase-DNA-binding protein 1